MQRAVEKAGRTVEPAAEVPAAFAEAMDDDLGVPAGLAVIHTTVRQGNSALAEDDKRRGRRPARGGAGHARGARARPARPAVGGEQDRGQDLHGVVDSLVRVVLDQREAARARKDWATADAIRDQLGQSGLVVEDGPDGPRWTLGGR